MKKITYTFQIDSGAENTSGEAAFREIFERGLKDAKNSVKAAALCGFRGVFMAECLSKAMGILKSDNRQDSDEALSMFKDAIDCVKSGQMQIQVQHDNDNAVFKDRFEGIKYTGEKDVCYIMSVKELEIYCENFSSKAMSIMDAYDRIILLLGHSKPWLELYSKIISLGEKFIQDVFTEYYINDKKTAALPNNTEGDELIKKWNKRLNDVKEEILKEEERIRREEEERRERERKLAEELARKEAEERARREAQEAAERIRREAEEAAERARKEAAERIAREKREAAERADYEKMVAKLNTEIEELEKKKSAIKAEYESVSEALGSKIADQEAEINLLNHLIELQHEIETELSTMREERTEKMAKYTKLGVFAGAEKKNLKIDIDRLDIEISGKESKLNSYKKEIESVDRRVNGRDNGARLKLKGYQHDMDTIDNEIAAIRKRIIDEKPLHMQ